MSEHLASSILVVKIGGSCLTDPNWPEHFQSWINRSKCSNFVCIVGGGEVIEAMRQLDTISKLDPIAMHWRCIKLLDVTFEVGLELLRSKTRLDIIAVESHDHFQTLRTQVIVNEGADVLAAERLVKTVHLVRVESFYSDGVESVATSTVPLPMIGWETTSDSIAVYLAVILGIRQCTLLKSCIIDAQHNVDEWIARSIIDEGVRTWKDFPIEISIEKI